MTAALCRDDPRHYTPNDLPRELHRFDTPVEPIGVGRPGKVGLLELTFAPRAGATRITHQFQQMPLQVFRPIYLDPQRPDMAFVYIFAHGGTLQGDRYRIDLRCEPAAVAHVTTRAATKLYRMEQNYATQWVHITVGADAVLEYLPDPVIPFRDSRFYGRTVLTVDPSASVILGETLLPGRVACGEQQAYTLFWSTTEAYATDGLLLFSDMLRLEPAAAALNTPGRLGPHAVPATLYVVTRRYDARLLADRLHAAIGMQPEIIGGASTLPNDSGAALRILGPTSHAVGAALHAAWDAVRLVVLGVPAPDRRKR
jgi:urease accessory protein